MPEAPARSLLSPLQPLERLSLEKNNLWEAEATEKNNTTGPELNEVQILSGRTGQIHEKQSFLKDFRR